MFIPYEVVLHNKKDGIISGDIGQGHTVLLTNNNNIITFGNNKYKQCSVLNKKDKIATPYYMNKSKEIGIDSDSFIERVIALNFETIIIINQIKSKTM